MKKQLASLLAAIVLVSTANANVEAPAGAAPAPKPKVYMLISAVGDQFTYVTQKRSVGSNVLDNFDRKVIKMPNAAIDVSVLTGLDNAIARRDPGSKRILARLNPLEMTGVPAVDRERIAMGKLLAALDKLPQREECDTIIVVTPKFQFSERKGMGSKLEGLGIYVQPLESASIGNDSSAEILGGEGEETITPDGKPANKRSSVFIAPYNYTQTWVFDAKSLKLLETSARYEYQKVYDPEATELNLVKSIPAEKLAQIFTKFVERSVARGVGEAMPSIEIGDFKTVGAPAAKPKP